MKSDPLRISKLPWWQRIRYHGERDNKQAKERLTEAVTNCAKHKLDAELAAIKVTKGIG